MEEKNSLANVAIGAGVALWVLFVIQGCLGCIPFVNMLAFFIVPINVLVSIAAVITGFLGMRKANELGGVGKGQAIAGMVLGLLYWVMLAAMTVLVFAMGGLSVILQLLNS